MIVDACVLVVGLDANLRGNIFGCLSVVLVLLLTRHYSIAYH